MSTTLIIIGGTGELGRKTVIAAEATNGTGWDGDIIATYRTSIPPRTSDRVQWVSLDVSDHKDVRSLLMSPKSLGAVIYCAIPKGGNASTKHNDTLRNGVVEDVVHCAEAVSLLGARFVSVSTDLVFDGKLPVGESYTESSKVGAVNAYGIYKCEMEKRLSGLSGNIVIARTSLILTLDDIHKENNNSSSHEKNDVYYGKGLQFVVDCVKGKHGEIELFTDELRNMSFADDLGKALIELSKPDCVHKGLLHMVSDECTNRWELAKLMAKRLGCEHLLGKYAKSGLSADLGIKTRPLNCQLSTKLCSSVLKTHIRGITERLG